MQMAKTSDLAREAADLGPWFHNLHLPDGTQTRPDHPFGDFPRFKWDQLAPLLPDDLSGWRCLDIGCNSGFYSFALAERGASVVGIDINDHYLNQARWAAGVYGVAERVSFVNRQIYDYARLEAERFDLVLFMGVLYHLRYPMLALDVARQLGPRLMVFQTLTSSDSGVHAMARQDIDFQRRHLVDEPGWPRLAFIEETFAKDPTNWWIANHAAVLGMLRAAGFAVEEHPAHELYLCRPMAQRTGYWVPEEFTAATGGRARS